MDKIDMIKYDKTEGWLNLSMNTFLNVIASQDNRFKKFLMKYHLSEMVATLFSPYPLTEPWAADRYEMGVL